MKRPDPALCMCYVYLEPYHRSERNYFWQTGSLLLASGSRGELLLCNFLMSAHVTIIIRPCSLLSQSPIWHLCRTLKSQTCWCESVQALWFWDFFFFFFNLRDLFLFFWSGAQHTPDSHNREEAVSWCSLSWAVITICQECSLFCNSAFPHSTIV